MQLNKDQRLGLKIVIALALLFLGFGAFQYPTIRSRRHALNTQHDMSKIRSSLEEFRINNSRFPTVEEFDRRFDSMRDAWGHRFRYMPSSNENAPTYRLGSPGHDGLWQHNDLKEYKVNILVFNVVKNADIIMSEEGLIQGSDFE